MSVIHLVSGSNALKSRSSRLRTPAAAGPVARAALDASSQASLEPRAEPSGERHDSGWPSRLHPPNPRAYAAHRWRLCCPRGFLECEQADADGRPRAHSVIAAPSPNNRWQTLSDSGTSGEPENHCGNVRSPDTSGRSLGKERCRFAQKIPLLLHPRQLAFETRKLFVACHSRTKWPFSALFEVSVLTG